MQRRIKNYLTDFIVEMCPLIPDAKVSEIANKWSEQMYERVSYCFEAVRQTNENMRSVAEDQVSYLEDELEDAQEEIEDLKERLAALS